MKDLQKINKGERRNEKVNYQKNNGYKKFND